MPDVRRQAGRQSPENELAALNASLGLAKGVIFRWNGSVFYPAKVPDLIGIADRRYIDHTATHRNRGIGDLMRSPCLRPRMSQMTDRINKRLEDVKQLFRADEFSRSSDNLRCFHSAFIGGL
jgi:hypothetical protein